MLSLAKPDNFYQVRLVLLSGGVLINCVLRYFLLKASGSASALG
jgi:hypothetical protein